MSENHLHLVINTENVNRSYVMGYDKNTGWDGYYHFTYFGQFRRSTDVLPVIEAMFISVLSVAVVCANVLVLVIMVTTKCSSTSNNYFLASMSLAAMLYPTGMPLIVATRLTETWIFSQAACSLVPYGEFCGAMVSVWTMTLMSIERHRVTRRKSPFRKIQTLTMIAVLWTVSVVGSLPLAVFFVVKGSIADGSEVIVCTLIWPNNDITMSYIFLVPCILLVFILPLAIITANYARILKILNESTYKLRQHRLSIHGSEMRSGIFNRKPFRSNKEAIMNRFLIILVVMFCIMWAPIAVCLILIVYDKATNHLIMTSEIFIAGECLALSNSLVNPLIYAFISERYRNGLQQILAKIRRVSQKQNQITPSTSQDAASGVR